MDKSCLRKTVYIILACIFWLIHITAFPQDTPTIRTKLHNYKYFNKTDLDVIQNVIKNDFLISDETMSGFAQHSPSIAFDSSGNFIIVWEDDRNDPGDIYCQRYNKSGIPQGDHIKVNADIGISSQCYPAVAMDKNGNFVVVWQDRRNDSGDIFFQQYNMNGEVQGNNKKVNDDSEYSEQTQPGIVMDKGGEFVIVWADKRNTGSLNFDIYFQRYNQAGVTLSGNCKVNDNAGTSEQNYPDIAMDGDGNFVIVWQDNRNGFQNYDIYLQRYDKIGIAQDSNIRVNEDAHLSFLDYSIQLYPSAAMDENGNIVVVWQDNREAFSDEAWNYDIYFQRFNNLGIAEGGNIRADDDELNYKQCWPYVSMDQNGKFIIVWLDKRNGCHICCQRFNAIGEPRGRSFVVNDTTVIKYQFTPMDIAIDREGHFIVVWENVLNTNWDIYYQRYDVAGDRIEDNVTANNDYGKASQGSPAIAKDGNGNFIIAWEDNRNGNWDIYYQYFNSVGDIQGVNVKANDDASEQDQLNPDIAMNERGDFILVWEDYRNGNKFFSQNDIYYQCYNSDRVARGNNVIANDNSKKVDRQNPSIALDINGNYVIAWEVARNGVSKSDIYHQRYNNSDIAQGTNVIVNEELGTKHLFPDIAMDGEGNYVIVWQDNRRSPNNEDIYYQCYDKNGLVQGNNVLVNDVATNARCPAIAMNPDGDFVVSWRDLRNSHWDIYFQRYQAGAVGVGSNCKANEDALTRYFSNSVQHYPSIDINTSGKFIIIWENCRSGNPDIIGQRYHADGSCWGGNYQIVTDDSDYIERSPVVAANEDDIVFCWEDSRNSTTYDVYAKRYHIYAKIVGWDWNSSIAVEDDIKFWHHNSNPIILSQNYPNPFNAQTTIRFTLLISGNTELKIYDLLGHEIETLIAEYRESGEYNITWHTGQLPSGIYLYRLKYGNHVETRKLILLK